MSQSSSPRIYTFKASGVIAKGNAVKFGADLEHVSICSAATDKIIGIAQSTSTAAEDLIEVAINGGGAKGLAGGTVALGDLLTSDANGALIATTTAANRIVGVAMASAVAADIFAVDVSISLI
jgi:hypothetical protein